MISPSSQRSSDTSLTVVSVVSPVQSNGAIDTAGNGASIDFKLSISVYTRIVHNYLMSNHKNYVFRWWRWRDEKTVEALHAPLLGFQP